MLSKKLLVAEVNSLKDIRSFVEVYEEVAATRMQRIRTDVIKARQFLQGLTEIFADVKYNYKSQVGKIIAQTKLNRNGRSVAVFVSANTGLYGDIINRTFQTFLAYLDANNADAVVIGKQGVRMIAETRPQILYNYFDFSDERVDSESLGMVMRYLLQFEKIVVFYGKFKNIVEQVPDSTSISGDEILQTETIETKHKQYLFEPSLEGIMQIFEGEILASLFEQVLHESNLAKFASRLTHLDQAIENIDGKLDNLAVSARVLRHKLDNKRQLARISGISIWAK